MVLRLNHALTACIGKINSIKLVDYLFAQADDPWVKYYIPNDYLAIGETLAYHEGFIFSKHCGVM